jgi:hypothetical protein
MRPGSPSGGGPRATGPAARGEAETGRPSDDHRHLPPPISDSGAPWGSPPPRGRIAARSATGGEATKAQRVASRGDGTLGA